MNDKNLFIAQVQAWLSFLVLGSFFVLLALKMFGFGPELEISDLKEFVMVILLFWFMRERGTKPEDTLPEGGKQRTTTTTTTESAETPSTEGEEP